MQDVMVTARMSRAKKEQGAAALKKMGKSASEAINELFDYVIENECLPTDEANTTYARERVEGLAQAMAWADSISLPADNRFSEMSDEEIRLERLRAKGRI